MNAAPALHHATPLPLPARGGLVRARCGPFEALLERVRGGFLFVWSDGRRAQRVHLGLDGVGELLLLLRLPADPATVVPTDPVVVAPHARLRGYVAVPLVPTLVWRQPRAGDAPLQAFQPQELAAGWSAEVGHGVLASSPWYARFPAHAASQLHAVLPVRVRNDGVLPHEVAGVPVPAAATLRPCRGGLALPVADLVVCGDALATCRRDRRPSPRTGTDVILELRA